MPQAPRVHKRKAAKRHQTKPETNRQATRAIHTGSPRWRAIRQQILLRDNYTCAACGRYGNQVDHIDGDSTNDAPDGSNYQTLCRPCHSTKTAGETGVVSILPRFRHRPLIPVTVICGPPGSGKSTYARAHAGPRDLIVDLDEIKARLSGCAVHDTPDDVVWRALAERNSILWSLTKRSQYKHCWFVVMAPRRTERQHWREHLCADVVMLDVSADECLRRIRNDPTRTGKAREYWERIVIQWWQRYIPDA